MRYLIDAQQATSVSMPLLVVLVLWLTSFLSVLASLPLSTQLWSPAYLFPRCEPILSPFER